MSLDINKEKPPARFSKWIFNSLCRWVILVILVILFSILISYLFSKSFDINSFSSLWGCFRFASETCFQFTILLDLTQNQVKLRHVLCLGERDCLFMFWNLSIRPFAHDGECCWHESEQTGHASDRSADNDADSAQGNCNLDRLMIKRLMSILWERM